MTRHFEPPRARIYFGLLLAALLAATRMEHAWLPFGLPDATLAVFFLAGILFSSPLLFVAFFVEAAMLDQIAFVAGVSDWCFTPAYPFLAAAYAMPWLAGRWLARRENGDMARILEGASALGLSAFAAFLISNASFFAFSGYFTEMTAADYARDVALYIPGYVLSPYLYASFAAACFYLTGETQATHRREGQADT